MIFVYKAMETEKNSTDIIIKNYKKLFNAILISRIP